MRTAALALALLAAPAAAEPVSPEAFEAMSAGRTLVYDRGTLRHGAEQYLPGRRVIWQYADGSCARGFWYAEGDALCFVYETGETPQCWLFDRRGGTYFARVAGLAAGDPSELRLSGELPVPLVCGPPGPGV